MVANRFFSFSSYFSSSSSSLQILSNSPTSIFSLYTYSLPPFHFLIIWSFPLKFSHPKLSFSFKTSYPHGTQVQQKLLCDFQQCVQPHLLEWGCTAEWLPFIDPQATWSSLGECKDQIGKFFKLFSFSSFALIFYLNFFFFFWTCKCLGFAMVWV